MASRRCKDHAGDGVDINDDNIHDACTSDDNASDDDETYGMETVAIGASASTPVSASASAPAPAAASSIASAVSQSQQSHHRPDTAAAVYVGAAAAETKTDKETALHNKDASTSASALPSSSSSEAHQEQYQYHQHHHHQQQQQSYQAVPSNPPAASATASATTSTSAALSPLDQTAAARAERRRLFLQRTSQTARRVWERINPNLQLCLCQTAAKQLEAESTYTASDRHWIASPTGAAAAQAAQTRADSMGRDWEVEIYRQFLFGDDDRTYSKCEGGVEDEGGDVNGDGDDEGNNENDEDGDGKNVSN